MQKFIDQAQNLVAYGFALNEDEQSDIAQNHFIQLFYSALDARRVLACAGSEIQVLISENSSEVSPLNLAAALHKDNPLRDIYLQKSEPQGLFISRVEAAGARGVVRQGEIKSLLGLVSGTGRKDLPTKRSNEQETLSDTASHTLQGSALKTPFSEDLSWLEEVLELEDLDDDYVPFKTKKTELAPPSLKSSAAMSSAEPSLAKSPISFEKETRQTLPPDTQELLSEVSSSQDGAMTVAFVSGRGGVGKSSLTVLTAFGLWRAGFKVALLDMDLQFGDISVLAGNEPDSKIQRAGIEQLASAQKKLPPLNDALLLIEAAPRPEQAEELVQQIPQMISNLRCAADIVLINTSCLWDEAAAVLARSVDKLVICMDQRATSVSAARQVVDLCIRLQIPSTRLHYLLNRCARNAPLTSIDASLAMGGVDIITICDGGSDVDELLSLGCPLEVLSSQTQLRQSLKDLAECLMAKPSEGMWQGEAFK